MQLKICPVTLSLSKIVSLGDFISITSIGALDLDFNIHISGLFRPLPSGTEINYEQFVQHHELMYDY